MVVVDKYAWHKPLYRQAQIMRLQGLPVDPGEGWTHRPLSTPMRPAAGQSTRRHCWRAIL
jgi:hypothetical protein